MNEFTAQFLVEAREYAEQASKDLLALEERPGDRALLESVFRSFHTLKGAAGIMKYGAMERLLHRAEDALQQVRSGQRTADPILVDALLATLGQLHRWFAVIEQTETLPTEADAEAVRILRLFEGASASEPSLADNWWEDLLRWARTAAGDSSEARSALRYTPDRDAFFQGVDPLAEIEKLPGIVALRLLPKSDWSPPQDMAPYDNNLVIEVLFAGAVEDLSPRLSEAGARVAWQTVERRGGQLADVARAILAEQVMFLRTEGDVAAHQGRAAAAGRVALNVLAAAGLNYPDVVSAAEQRDRHGLATAIEAALVDRGDVSSPQASEAVPREAGNNTIRVDVARIDEIVRLTSEILVVKNALGHWARMAAQGADHEALAAGLRLQHDILARNLADLQAAAFNLRVLPLERVFGRFPRLVRETAASLGKQARLITEGADTRADKAIIESLFEPLLHILRNALDHGIETPDRRLSSGKPAEATLILRAFRESDHVVVELEDDGRGIDVAHVREAAILRGIVDETTAAQLNEDQIAQLIFAAGFSTADAVTDLSGRGVGMGAVRTTIERLGGEVSLLNQPGRGLTVRLVLPFTIALTRIMTLEAGGQTFGLPFDVITETVRIGRDKIRPLGQGHVVVLRDRTIPVLDLAGMLKLPGHVRQETACLLVIRAAGQDVALEIERPGERFDMMMKPAEGILGAMPAIAGTSLTGDGHVLIILDPKALLS